jgi:hypothetical protein
MIDLNRAKLDGSFSMLANHLRAMDAPHVGLVVCGGASLLAVGLVSRTTRDVDILALMEPGQGLTDPDPLPPHLLNAAAQVESMLGLPPEWLNNRPSLGEGGLFRMGLPSGLDDRLHERRFGDALTIWFIGRIDQIHLKLYAAVDRGGYHITDLVALQPSENELEQAARWAMTHDVSQGFRGVLGRLLRELGYGRVVERL